MDTIKNKSILIISDLHLGCKDGADNFGDYKENWLINKIKELNPSVIIIVGDLFELWQTTYYKIFTKYYKLLNVLFKPSTVYIKGNHDWNISKSRDFRLYWAGKIVKKYEINIDGKKAIFLHGHQFDKVNCNPDTYWILKPIVWIYGWIERLFLKNKKTPASLEYTGNYNEYRIGAMKLREKGYDLVIMGHTHFVENLEYYINTGSLTGSNFDTIFYKNE